MALIEHLEGERWDEALRGIFAYTLDVLKDDRFESVGSGADDLRSWLTLGGVDQVREHLDNQMEMRRFSPARKSAVQDCLDQLEREHRDELAQLTAGGRVPKAQERPNLAGASASDLKDLLERLNAGERPFEDWMHAHGHSDEEIAEIYRTIDGWLAREGIISKPGPLPSTN